MFEAVGLKVDSIVHIPTIGAIESGEKTMAIPYVMGNISRSMCTSLGDHWAIGNADVVVFHGDCGITSHD